MIRLPVLNHRATLLLLACSLALPTYIAAANSFEQGLASFEEARKLRDETPSEREAIARLFRQAADSFVSASNAGKNSPEVLTNAANSFYFAGDYGEAVLYYRRALAIDPWRSEAKDALESIRKILPIQKASAVTGTLADSLFFWHGESFFLIRLWTFLFFFPAAWILFTVETTRARWRWTQALLILVLPAALFAWAISYLFRLRRPFAIIGVLCLLPATAALVSMVVDAASGVQSRQAVILVEVQGQRGDGSGYQPSHSGVFPAGTEVVIEGKRGTGNEGWSRIRLLDDTTSWVPARTLETILP